MSHLTKVSKNLYQGGFPEAFDIAREHGIKFGLVINVSDAIHSFDCSYEIEGNPFRAWFPINEVGKWGYEPFVGVVRTIESYHKKYDGNILIHCSAGVYRSVILTQFYLNYINEESSCEFFHKVGIRTYNEFIESNRCPDKLNEFMQTMKETVPTYGLCGILGVMLEKGILEPDQVYAPKLKKNLIIGLNDVF